MSFVQDSISSISNKYQDFDNGIAANDSLAVHPRDIFGEASLLKTTQIVEHRDFKTGNNTIIVGGAAIFLSLYFVFLILCKSIFSRIYYVLFLNKTNELNYYNFSNNFIQLLIILSVFSSFVISIFIYIFLFKYLPPFLQSLNPAICVLIMQGAILLFFLFKQIIASIANFMHGNETLGVQIKLIQIGFWACYGIFFTPLIILSILHVNEGVTSWSIVVLCVFLFLYCIKLGRLSLVFIREKILLLFLILYLCVLEILPIWFIVDFFLQNK